MNVVWGAVVLVGAFAGARWLVVDRFVVGPSDDRLGERLVERLAFATIAFALFLSTFLLQGFAELALRRPLITLSTAAAIAVVLAALAYVASHGLSIVAPSTTTRVRLASRPRSIPRLLAIALLAIALLLVVLLVAGFPRGFEVHAYHLPIAVRLFQQGTLSLWDHVFMHAYPAEASIWAGFFLDLVPERWVSIANLPFAALMGGAVYALSLAAGADRSAALLVSLGLATIPVFGFSSIELGADVGGVAFVAVAAVFIVGQSLTPTRNAALAGLAAGLAFGFKSLNLIPIAVLGLFLLASGLRDWTTRRTSSVLVPTLAYSAAATATMSYWLVRNLVEAGNPLYPVHLGALFDLFGWKPAFDFSIASRIDNEHEWVARSRDWLWYPWVEGHYIKQNFKHSSGLGPFFAATVPIVAVLWPVRMIAALRFGDLPATLIVQAKLFAVAIVVTIAWWMLGDRQPRYVMVAIALLMPIAATLITSTTGRSRVAYEGLLATGILLMALVLLIRLAVDNGAFLLQQRGATRAQSFQYPPAVDRLPAGSIIANGVDREVSYALLGDGFSNRVVDAAEIDKRFATADRSLALTRDGVQALGFTHLYVEADRTVHTDECVRLEPVARLDRNPLNGQPLKTARLLFAVAITCK